MLIIPAIDLRDGNCVRLKQGDPTQQTVYSHDPVSVARGFEALGARLIHVVDLDGAFHGRPINHEAVLAIARAVSIPIEIGGGIRTEESVARYVDAGIKRIILGSVLLTDAVRPVVDRYASSIIAGIDARDGMVATHGWKNNSAVRALTLIAEMKEWGIREVIYTDIATDGMLQGPNIAALGEILDTIPGISLIASGGVSTLDDIRALAALSSRGITGCIVGKAIYDGRIDLREAMAYNE